MVQPKYNPQEALERVKLMMNYDSSRTLTENKQQINEILWGLIPATLGAAKWIAGTAAVGGIAYWINNSLQGGDSFQKTKTFFAGCSKNLKSIKPTVSPSEYRAAADQIYDAIEGLTTDEDVIKSALLSMPTVADLCALNAYYSQKYGDLYNDLDDDIDGQDFVTYVWSAISDQINGAREEIVEVEDCEKNPDQPKCKQNVTSGTTNTTKCVGTYKPGCFALAIGEVQKCLGITPNGEYDAATAAELEKLGYKEFTDADIPKICKKPNEIFDVEVDAEEAEDLLNL
jgi:hypothetical protein